MTLNEIRARGYAALMKELGPVGYVRFLQQFDAGRGDYTEERAHWLDGLGPDDVNRILAARRQSR